MKLISRSFSVEESMHGVAGPCGMLLLPPAEYRLFLAVAAGRGRPVGMRALFRTIWPMGVSGSALRRLVYRLRRRIGTKYVENVRGIGYRLVDA